MNINKIFKTIVFIVIGIIGALLICCCVFLVCIALAFGLPEQISSESRENIKIEEENREACVESAKKWMQETYGDAIYKTISIEKVYTFKITDPFMAPKYLPKTVIIFSTPFYKSAKLFVDSKDHNDIFCNMRLLDNYSFRGKIYNKWIKQKLVVNDDNIFFYYKDGYLIDYTEIKNLENINENICEAIRNVEIDLVDIINYEYITIDELMNYVISILNAILENKPEIVGNYCRFVVRTLNEDRYYIKYKKGDGELRWYKNDWKIQDDMNIYIISDAK